LRELIAKWRNARDRDGDIWPDLQDCADELDAALRDTAEEAPRRFPSTMGPTNSELYAESMPDAPTGEEATLLERVREYFANLKKDWPVNSDSDMDHTYAHVASQTQAIIQDVEKILGKP
jgi:hypothetical protein